MYKIMFVCHGNICRSPMAEFIMKDLVKKECPEAELFIASSATSTEEIGNPVYPPAKAELSRRGIPFGDRQAVQVKKSDYGKYDIFLVMDGNNVRNIMRIFGSDPDGKVRRLSEFSGESRDISDPWYSGRFDVAFDDICKGCTGLLEHIRREKL